MDGTSIRLDPLLAAGTPVSRRDLALALHAAGHSRLVVIEPEAAVDDDVAALALASRLTIRRLTVEPGGDALDRAFFTLFRGTHYPTGLICADAALATAAVRCLREFGFRVPGDMTVTWPGSAIAPGDPYYPRGPGTAPASPR